MIESTKPAGGDSGWTAPPAWGGAEPTAAKVAPCVLQVSKWPEILVGPIVRRVDDGRTVMTKDQNNKTVETAGVPSVTVFLVLSRPRVAKLKVYLGNAKPEGRDPLNPNPTAFSTIAIGAKLHVVVMREEIASLQRGTVYGYDIELSDPATSPNQTPITTLKSAGLLDDPTYPLGYAPGLLPSFVLPQTLDKLRMVHASCRKAHGGGPDALSTLDLILEKNHDQDAKQLSCRPQQLFLTGDQIYADDVAIALLNSLAPLGRELLGWDEQIQLDRPSGGKSAVSYTDPLVAPGARSDFLFEQIDKPKTGYAENHLLFFGDFCAMYVMSWSPALWAKDSAGVPTLTPTSFFVTTSVPETVSDKTSVLPGGGMVDESALDAFTSALVQTATGTTDTTAAVLDYARNLPRIRRTLANIATCMIFDDHEVTDDWYLNGECWLRFRGSKVGRRLLRNALSAYAVFQDWGNRATDYARANSAYANLLGKLVHTNASGIKGSNPACCDALLDIGPPATSGWIWGGKNLLATPHSTSRVDWHYALAWEEHVVLALDTRTWRYFPESKIVNTTADALTLAKIFAPDFLTRSLSSAGSELADQLQEGWTKLNAHLIEDVKITEQVNLGTSLLTGKTEKKRTFFVISAAPVFGFLIVETLQRIFVIRDGANAAPEETGAESRDNEPWIGSTTATSNLLVALSAQPTILLSGDVHYAYSTLVKWAMGNSAQKFVQLCSSAAKNSEPLTEVLALTDHITAVSGADGWSRALNVGILLTEVISDVGGVIFQPDEDKQSRFVEDIEDKVFTVLGGKVGESLEDLSELPDNLADQVAHDLVTYMQNPWRVFLGDSLIEGPTNIAELSALVHDPVAGLGCTLISLQETLDGTTQFGLNRILSARFKGHWYEDFRGYAQTWLSTFSTDDQAYIGKWNFLSVGHSNMGIISFEGAGTSLVHELAWYSNLQQNGAPWLWGAESITKQPLLMTRHTQAWPPV